MKNATINFNWGTGLVTPNAADYCSVRWIGKIKFPTAEIYTIYFNADELLRVYLNRVLIIDRWYYSAGELSFTVNATSTQIHDIRIDYGEYEGSAYINMSWSSASIGKQIIPSLYLYSVEYVANSPYSLIISQGDTVANMSTAVLPNSFKVGENATIYIQSRDYNGTV